MIQNEYLNKIINADVIEGLRQFPDGIANTCVTSPPYYGLRDYGHDAQIGIEQTPQEYVDRMVGVFREVRRVLRDDGTIWLNVGDSYTSPGGDGRHGATAKVGSTKRGVQITTKKAGKPKDLLGIPWMLAFALRDDGWYLRQDIIWHKPNPMPESVTDRCTKAHEYIFLLAKSQRYYYDHEAIREQPKPWNDVKVSAPKRGEHVPTDPYGQQNDKQFDEIKGANRRSVWSVNTKPYSGAHFAVFPEELIAPCILAGAPEGGVVLDPFMGSGTTAYLAKKLNRNYIGTELNAEYMKLQQERINSIPPTLFSSDI